MHRFSLAVTALLLSGCYGLQPLGGVAPEPGSRVAYDVNDAGRVALGGLMGPEIIQIEGRFLGQDSTGILLAVSSTRFLRGGTQTWRGEQVRLRPEHLTTAYGRDVYVGRSVAFGGAALGGFTALLLTTDLLATGSEKKPGEEDPGNTRIGRP